ncbi:MAG: hypothetical protein LUB83_04780 [Prevotellaceae bacterium]|nr:hypothetical protein [Prevotellaceae bacterium]
MLINKRILATVGLWLLAGELVTLSAQVYSFTDQGQTYPLSEEGSKYVVSGFTPFYSLSDDVIYANALLWTIDNICDAAREGITEVNVNTKSFSYDLTLESSAGSSQSNLYTCKVKIQVASGKLVYYISNIQVQSQILLLKKVTPIEKLQPDKKESHKSTVNDFVKMESQVLNKMFDFVNTNTPSEITHWTEINIGKPVTGMTEDECLMAFGKPQSVSESNGETQWMYTSSFYLFFKNGKVDTIIK